MGPTVFRKPVLVYLLRMNAPEHGGNWGGRLSVGGMSPPVEPPMPVPFTGYVVHFVSIYVVCLAYFLGCNTFIALFFSGNLTDFFKFSFYVVQLSYILLHVTFCDLIFTIFFILSLCFLQIPP